MLAGPSPAHRRPVPALPAVVLPGAVLLTQLLCRSPVPNRRAGRAGAAGTRAARPGVRGGTASPPILADRLTAGRDATGVARPGNGAGDLDLAADALDQAATAALARTGEESVAVVGHSAGGIVARLRVADGNASLVRRVGHAGTPHHGTRSPSRPATSPLVGARSAAGS